MISLAICEDQTVVRRKIRDLVSAVYDEIKIPYTCRQFQSGEMFLQDLAAGAHYDIALLDIVLGGINGLDVAKELRLRLQDHKTLLIYISSYGELAKETLPLQAHRFLTKPIVYEKFKEALSSAYKTWKENQNRNFTFKDVSNGQSRGLITVPLDEIIYFHISRIRNSSRTIELNALTDSYTFRGSMKELAAQLLPADFLHIHHSFLINVRHIRRITYEEVEMDSGRILPISGPKRPKIRKQYADMLKRQEGLWL